MPDMYVSILFKCVGPYKHSQVYMVNIVSST